ncbi:methionine biosynthesis protein MetW [Luminiphilus sp.]|nr:methionine biosynthesis protein MetW [Luminiphilus sp.]MDB3899073.1 methionine biosynthesis protein MetW [Luminiphilus sp.]
MMLRSDIETIAGWVGNGSKVLDLGCGNGDLLAKLSLEKGIDGVGVDIDTKNLTTALSKGLRVIQQDMEDGLPNFENTQFDVVIIADSLQVLKRPHAMLTRVVQIGHEAIVSFPNFGHWRSRLSLLLSGRMPKTKALPYSWFDTPNIHFCTVADFESLCRQLDIEIIERKVSGDRTYLAKIWPNIFAKSASYRIRHR